MSDELITLPRHLVETLFDLNVKSMNFGSGFLYDEDVKALRTVAELLGEDPLAATPSNFLCKYRKAHRWMDRRNKYPVTNYPHKDAAWWCPDCGMWTAKDPPPPWPEGTPTWNTPQGSTEPA